MNNKERKLRFRKLKNDDEIDSIQVFKTYDCEVIKVTFGTFGRSPAIRYTVKNAKGRIIENGGSIVSPSAYDKVANYKFALSVAMPRFRIGLIKAMDITGKK